MTPTQTQLLESARKAVELAQQERRECEDDATEPWEYQNTLYALHFHLKDFAPQAADYIEASVPREAAKDAALKVAIEELRFCQRRFGTLGTSAHSIDDALARIQELLKTP